MILALLDLQFCDSKRAKDFECSKCPPPVQKLRKCREDRNDFGPEDAPFWPMRVQDGGDLYGFCPGKATWFPEVVGMYRAMVLCAETGQLWDEGGIASQPAWFVELASTFLPQYNESRFFHRAKAILGDGKGANTHGSNARKTPVSSGNKR